MALTPDDIVNKTFETTRFRDGYDQDEVDNFLDEVVGEYRRLLEENESLKARVAELEAGGSPAPAAPVTLPAPDAAVSPAVVTGAPETVAAEAEPVEEKSEPVTEAPIAEAPVVEAPAAVAAPAVAAGGSADSLLALAQRVHDEHVTEGETRKAALIAEGEEAKAQIEKAGEERKTALVAEYDQKRQELEKTKSELESKIDELKTFERDYRLKLRGYIESQLRDLDRSSSLAFGSSGDASTQQNTNNKQ